MTITNKRTVKSLDQGRKGEISAFNWCLNVSSDGEEVTSEGKSFQEFDVSLSLTYCVGLRVRFRPINFRTIIKACLWMITPLTKHKIVVDITFGSSMMIIMMMLMIIVVTENGWRRCASWILQSNVIYTVRNTSMYVGALAIKCRWRTVKKLVQEMCAISDLSTVVTCLQRNRAVFYFVQETGTVH